MTKVRQSQILGLVDELTAVKEQIKTFKPPVNLFENLPLEGNNDGDVRVCLENGNLYIWSEKEMIWKISTDKAKVYTNQLSFEIQEDNQTIINTGIRFDETTEFQTSVDTINLYLNGMFVNDQNYVVKNIDEELVIEWTSIDSPLLIDDLLDVQYYDITGKIAVKTLASGNVTEEEKEYWNSKADGDHTHTEYSRASYLINGNNDYAIRVHQGLGESTTTYKMGTFAFAEGSGTKATGNFSHAEGSSSTASGPASHAEGVSSTASGQASHAEGYQCTALEQGSHAEGMFTRAEGSRAHAEGNGTTASGSDSHAEGNGCIARGSFSHAEGYNSQALGRCSHAEGDSSKSEADYSHVEGYGCTIAASCSGGHAEGYKTSVTAQGGHAEGTNTKAAGTWSHAQGQDTEARGLCSHAEGYRSVATQSYAHAEGNGTTASGQCSHAEGMSTTASGLGSHAEGNATMATSEFSHAQGLGSKASAMASHAEGNATIASGMFSHAQGCNATAETFCCTTMGTYNVENTGQVSQFAATNNALVIGNGTSMAKSNAFRVTFEGAVYGNGAYNSTGADYAEYFEWEDGNVNSEDRIGRFVTMVGDKIKVATSKDDYIIGAISGTASVIGNSYDDQWHGMYIKDEYGRHIYEEIETEVDTVNEKGEIIKTIQNVLVLKINPEYDQSMAYTKRSVRKEWDAVGMLGQLIVKDDGTCEVDGYCVPSNNGVATKSETGYRVLKRINENLIKVLFK